jgi:hypothetical protein
MRKRWLPIASWIIPSNMVPYFLWVCSAQYKGAGSVQYYWGWFKRVTCYGWR